VIRHNLRWTKQQDALLIREYRQSRMATLSALLNRTPNAIYQRAKDLGLRKNQIHVDRVKETDEDIERKLAALDRMKRRARWAA
jgi:hypothetical protein